MSEARTKSGLLLAVASAFAFGLAGSLASSLFAAGWNAGAVSLLRVGIGASVLLPFGLAALRGRWHSLRCHLGLILCYGLLAVAGAQFCYFTALQRMAVGPALLIEYTAPAAVVAWCWWRHGQRPSPGTLLGSALAAVGLAFVLNLFGGATLDPVGVAWALAAMIGLSTYFVFNASDNGLPPLTLAAGGLIVGAIVLALLAAVGLLPLRVSTDPVTLAGAQLEWWVPVLLLGLVSAGLAYVTGIAAGRRLGARLSSFIALLEVIAGVAFASVLLAQLPHPMQLFGGALILTGIVAMNLAGPATPSIKLGSE